MALPAHDWPRLSALVFGRIRERGEGGATSAELAALALRADQVPEPVAHALLEPLLARDRRAAYGPDGRWRLNVAAATTGSLAAATFVVTDVETTGTGRDCRIIEIGAARVRNGAPAGTFRSLVDPEQPLPPEIVALTGITGAMLEGAPSARDVLPKFAEFLGDAVFVAHNAAFDRRFVYGQADRECGIALPNPVLCTRNLARRLMPDLASRSLDALCTHLRIHVADRHRALGDALATAAILRHLLDLAAAQGIAALEDLILFQTAAGARALQKRNAGSKPARARKPNP